MAAATIYPLLDILWWNLVGQWMQYIFVHITSSTLQRRLLPRFDDGAPQWWRDSWGPSYVWNDNLDNRIPNAWFAVFYRWAARDRYREWVNEAADNIARVLTDAIYALLGTMRYGYVTFSDWIAAIRGRVGSWVPWWTSTLAAGLDFLRNLFPGDIRDGIVSWYDKFVAWYNAAISWAESRYEATRVWVANTGSWLVSGYNTVRAWYDSSHDWLDDFRYNIYARITAWLGPPWTFLHGAWWHLQNFYNNVWIPYQVTLHDFLADPLGWLYDRVEDELVRRW